MFIIQSKLVDIKSDKCVGVVCINGATSVALSLEKAKELGVEDIDIIEYLDSDVEKVVINPKRPSFYALISNSQSILDDFTDIPYDHMGSPLDLFSRTEIIWGYVFKYIDFIELDNEVAIKRAISDLERDDSNS